MAVIVAKSIDEPSERCCCGKGDQAGDGDAERLENVLRMRVGAVDEIVRSSRPQKWKNTAAISTALTERMVP
jgi:hypothetical protein